MPCERNVSLQLKIFSLVASWSRVLFHPIISLVQREKACDPSPLLQNASGFVFIEVFTNGLQVKHTRVHI